MTEATPVPGAVFEEAVGLMALKSQIVCLENERHTLAQEYLGGVHEMLAGQRHEEAIQALNGFKVAYGTGWVKVANEHGIPKISEIKAKAYGAYNDGEGMWKGMAPLSDGECRPPSGRWVVYQLLDGEELVYIGSTGSFPTRLKAHLKDKKFDRWRAAECPNEAECRSLEVVLINNYRPRLNRMIARPTRALVGAR